MYRINMLHYISISKFLREIMTRVIFLLAVQARVIFLLTEAGLEITGRKDAKCVCFFIFASENCHVNDKNCACIFQQVYSVSFYLCSVPKCVFSVFNFRINFKTQSIYILRCWGLQFNWFVSVDSSQPLQFCSGLETSGSDITCVLMFDVLSNEKSRKS